MTQLTITPAPADLWKDIRSTETFPILAETRDRIRQQMQQARVSFDELAPSIESDPALCMNLLMLAARQHPGCVEQISGAAGCLSLLGMQELVKLMKKMTVIEPWPEKQNEIAYRRAIMCARFAGNLAAEWSAIKGTQSSSYARWSTMLTMAPLWSWLLHWPQAANWQYRVSQGDSLQRAAEQIFGADEKHWLLVLRHLHMPQMAQQVYSPEDKPDSRQWRILRHHDPRDLDNQRPLIHLCQAPAMTSLMANQLAWHLHMAPTGKHTERWLTLTCHWLGKPLHQIAPKVRLLQLQTSRQQHSTLGTGLHLLLSPHPVAEPYPFIAGDDAAHDGTDTTGTETATTQTKAAATTAATTTTEAGKPESAEAQSQPSGGDEARHIDHAYMKKLLNQLQQEPDSFGDWHFLMKCMLKGVTEGLGLPQACVALLNKDKTRLKIIYTEGVSADDPLRRFNVDLTRPSLFTRLLEKTAGLMLTPDNREKFLNHLPASVTDLIPSQSVMMSINAGASPIGLVMGFADAQQAEISQAEYAGFKNLCMIASQSLATLRANTLKNKAAGRPH
ncbi:MAG: hypothetical protein CMI02_01545 [Oceanospirillaceae bacterium]|nr:hypothetical protein [Oceanospirillaceae bacterium]MBT10703.1 hypothetical protein [Oceanospirillaceae bacterium]|tara:strand:+ start:25982 stop:27661 length:1680 start_codon:yes stop_codon:yes gene_type:complete